MRSAVLFTSLLLASCYAPDYANKYVCNPANNGLDCPDGWVCVARRCVLPGSGGAPDQGSSAGSPDQRSQQMCSVAGCDACACPDGGMPLDGMLMLMPDQSLPKDGSVPGMLKLLIVHTSLKSVYWLDVQAKLMATGSFSRADLFDATSATPTLVQLQAYDTVLVYAQLSWHDAADLGDNLADYWDGGGRVVLAPLADSNVPVQGRFGDPANGYILISPAGLLAWNDSLGTILEPASPLVDGVHTLTASQAYRSAGSAINGGIVVAQWQTGEPLIVRGKVKGRNRVDINMQPPSSDGAGVDGWTGDGDKVMRNALVY